MSLARERMPSDTIRSTSRTTGRWLASSALIWISSGGASCSSCVTSVPLSMPSSSFSTTFSGRYSSSVAAASLAGAASSSRTSRPVANASAFSMSRSNGFAVPISR